MCAFNTYAQNADGDGALDNVDIDDDNDGIVSVERGRIEGMNEFHVMDADHTFISSDERVMAMTRRFLRDGKIGSGRLFGDNRVINSHDAYMERAERKIIRLKAFIREIMPSLKG